MSQPRPRRFRPALSRLEDRVTPAGALDPTFGVGGKVTTTALQSGSGLSVAVDNFGRTVVAGFRFNGSNDEVVVTRYTSDGALDATFGGTGIVTFASGTFFRYANGVAVDSQNRVVVVGHIGNGSDWDFAVARLTPDGALDASFDGDGKQTVAFGDSDDLAYSVTIDKLDRIVVAGVTQNGSNSDFAVARLTPAGVLDSNFDADGKQIIAFGATSDDIASGVAVDSLNRVVVAGSTNAEGSYDFAVARLTVAGALDTSFDADGQQTIAFGVFNEFATSVAVDSQDQVVVAGETFNGQNNDFAVARLTETGALDSSFGADGKQTITFGASNEIAYGVAIDSFDRVVAAGETFNGWNNDFAVARLTKTGALDTKFASDGKQTFGFVSSDDDTAYGVAIASTNRVIVAGGSNLNGQALARLTGDTTTAAAQINDGSVQRSRVTSLKVRFSGQVTFAGKAIQAFTLTRIGGGAVTFSASVTVEYGGTVVTVSNFSGNETNLGSLRDGRYTLTTLASQITSDGQPLDGDADGAPGGNFVFGDAQGLFRFFGDFNGDRRVDIADFGLFSLSYLNAANYVAGFDFNGDGRIDIADFGQFAVRYLAMLP